MRVSRRGRGAEFQSLFLPYTTMDNYDDPARLYKVNRTIHELARDRVIMVILLGSDLVLMGLSRATKCQTMRLPCLLRNSSGTMPTAQNK